MVSLRELLSANGTACAVASPNGSGKAESHSGLGGQLKGVDFVVEASAFAQKKRVEGVSSMAEEGESGSVHLDRGFSILIDLLQESIAVLKSAGALSDEFCSACVHASCILSVSDG